MGRGMTVAVVCAAGVGSVGGGLTALHVTPSPGAQPSDHLTGGAGVAQPASAAPAAAVSQPHAPDPHAVLVIQMRAVLGRVAEWSLTHAGAPCPDAATLG